MREVTTAPTPGDTIVRALIHAQMDDGRPISSGVKVDTMFDHLGIVDAPIELKRLVARGIQYRLGRKRGTGLGRSHV